MNIHTFTPEVELRREEFLTLKGEQSISVCIPCRNEEKTIGKIVEIIKSDLLDKNAYIDELIVIDDRSEDLTAKIAEDNGAQIVHIDAINSIYGEAHGKGNALWGSLLCSKGDIIVWVDGDLTTFEANWITKLSLPLLINSEINLVKGFYERTEETGGGGRTTELVARPLLSLYFPELAHLLQPLAGEYAGRREALTQINFLKGWGVEIGMLIDIERAFGISSIAQVDLGVREHRHRPLSDLSEQSAEIIAAVHSRSPLPKSLPETDFSLRKPDGSIISLNVGERESINKLEVDAEQKLTGETSY